MTTPRDRPGTPMTAADIHRAQAELGDDPEPDNYCTVCGWTGNVGGTCRCDDGTPRS